MARIGLRLGAALGVLATVGCGGLAAAQVAAEPPRPVGQSSLHYALSFTETYDSDVARSSDAQAALRHLTPEDYKSNVNVNLDILRAVGRQSVFVTGDLGYDFYDKNTVLNRQRIDVEGGAVARAGPCEVVIADRVASAQTNLDLLINAVIENEQTVNTVSASGQCVRRIGFTPTFSVSTSQARNSASTLKGQNYDQVSGSLGVAYSRPTLGRLSLYGRYTRTDYTRSSPIAIITGRTPTYEVTEGGLSFERAIGERLNLTSHIGYSSVSQNVNANSQFEGLTYGASLMFAPTSRAVINLSAERAVKPSVQIGATYEVMENYAEGLSYRLSHHLTLGAGATQARTSYNGTSLGPALVLPGQTSGGVFANATYDFLRRNTLRLEIRQEERRSNIAAFNYESNQVSLTFTRHN